MTPLPIRRTASADDDLIAIWLHIATQSPAAADRTLDAIERRCLQLGHHPLSGVARTDIRPGIRHLVAGSYLILYRVEVDSVLIVRVLHGRREMQGAMSE